MRNEIDEEYMLVHSAIKFNLTETLKNVVQNIHGKKSAEWTLKIYEGMKSDTVPADVAVEIIEVMYSQESFLKTTILERVEVEVRRETQKQLRELIKQTAETRTTQRTHCFFVVFPNCNE